MKKLRLYLDTSVISYLDQQDAPALMAETHRLWEKIKAGEQETDEVLDLAELYLKAKILHSKSLNDCRHIAYACVYNCDMVLSWNFKHLVNYKTISGVKSVNAIAGYREMLLYTPTFLIEGDTEDDT
ncbi:MAG: hypothetical protein LBS35_13935 [Synergistaceae bacterium]|nr:hypothetical protein [Synergistaceae bacterium]